MKKIVLSLALAGITLICGCSSSDDAAQDKTAKASGTTGKIVPVSQASQTKDGKNVAEALKVIGENLNDFDSKCSQNSGMHCAFVGLHYQETEHDYKKSIAYLNKSCKLDDPIGCGMLGDAYRKGLGVKTNPRRAYQFYTISCNKNIGGSCGNLAEMHETGIGAKQDIKMAGYFYARACKLKEQEACVKLKGLQEKGFVK